MVNEFLKRKNIDIILRNQIIQEVENIFEI